MGSTRKTTAGILTTLGVAATGTVVTVMSSLSAKEKCRELAQQLTELLVRNLTIPAITQTALITLPGTMISLFGQMFSIPEMERNVTVAIPETQLDMMHILGVDHASLQIPPDLAGQACGNAIALHGAELTLIATTLLGTLTALYHLNHKINHKLATPSNLELGNLGEKTEHHSRDSLRSSRQRAGSRRSGL